MTREEAEKLFKEKYEEAITKRTRIENKVAWALYQAWKEADKDITRKQAIGQLKTIKAFHNGSYGPAIDMAIEALSEEEKTAKWIPYPSLYSEDIKVTCSHCTHMQDKPTNYCSSCGAKMEQEG